MKKIDYFILGAQKAGTTALFRKISSNQPFFKQRRKELHFFDHEMRDWGKPDYGELDRFFTNATADQFIGDATPIYMYWPNAMERIARYNPQAKIIIILRHPSYRALSQWKMEIARGKEYLSFSEAISTVGRNRLAAFGGVHRYWSYVERGFYSGQIQRAQKIFPKENIFFCTNDDLFTNETALINRIFTFIGAAPNYSATQEKIIKPMDNDHIIVDVKADISYLNGLYRSDIEKTAEMTGLNLQGWNAENYREKACCSSVAEGVAGYPRPARLAQAWGLA